MIEQKIKVTSGLESRPAALFVQTASKFSSSVKVQIDDRTANAKSIMGIISLGILDGQDVTLIVDGEDEVNAVDELKNFLKSN